MRSLILTAALLVALPVGAVNIEYVAVRDPGNPPDTAANCPDNAPDCGSVPYDYAISKYEVTNAQYAEFLNLVAVPADPAGLYNEANPGIGVIIEIPGGILGYYLKAGFENKPVTYVSFWDALRFANWLHNGQPRGIEDETTTEDGAYTITASGVSQITIDRNEGAQAFVPTNNEWYKAAYYEPMLHGERAATSSTRLAPMSRRPARRPPRGSARRTVTGP